MPRVRRNKKEKDEEKNISVILPPCLVCDGKASGLHFGVNTCEACKAFFRRCLHRDKDAPLVCQAEKDCTIYFQNKFLCPYCRFQKCLRVGMSKEAIKTGRYTLEHKAGLQKQAESRQAPAAPQVLDQAGPPLSHQSPDSGVTNSPESEPSPQDDLENQDRSPPSDALQLGQNVAELEEVTSVVLRAFQVFSPYTEEIKARIHQEQSEYQAQRDLIEELFGPMQPLTREEYLEIYRTTGIDIDGRMERARSLLPSIKKSITSMVKFARHIPGFTELPIDDQVILIEGCGVEWWVINAVVGVNVEGGLFTSFFGITHTKAEMASNHPPCSVSTVDLFFRMAAILQDVKTNSTTDALLAAICITNPEGRKLSNHQMAEDIQYKLIEALSLQLSRTKRYSLKVLHKLLEVSKEMRKSRPHDVLNRKENGQYTSPMGAHMAPIIHALVCERPPNCNACQVEPCKVHEHYHPQKLPTFKSPPPLRCPKKNKSAQNFIQMAMDWQGHRAICPEGDYSEGMMRLKGETLSMPIDYSSRASPEVTTCGLLPACMDDDMHEESTNMPIDYSTYDMRSESSPCCLSVSSEGTDCTAAEVRGKINSFELSESRDGFESPIAPGKGNTVSPYRPGASSPPPGAQASGTFDKWQALQKVCQHFIDEYESSSSSGKRLNYQTDTNESQMDIELIEPAGEQLGHQNYSGKNLQELSKLKETENEPMDDTDRTYSSASYNLTHNGKNEAMVHSWRSPGKPYGKPTSYRHQSMAGPENSTALSHQHDLIQHSGKNIEALSYMTKENMHNSQLGVPSSSESTMLPDRGQGYKGKNIEQIFDERRSQTDLYTTSI